MSIVENNNKSTGLSELERLEIEKLEIFLKTEEIIERDRINTETSLEEERIEQYLQEIFGSIGIIDEDNYQQMLEKLYHNIYSEY